MPLGRCRPCGTHQGPAHSPQCASAGSLMPGSQKPRPPQQQRGESISGARSTPQPVGHVSRHDPSPASPLTPSCSPSSSRGIPQGAMGGCRREGPGGLSTAGQPWESLWVHRDARWHPRHPPLEPGMPQQSQTSLGGAPTSATAACQPGGSAVPTCPPTPGWVRQATPCARGSAGHARERQQSVWSHRHQEPGPPAGVASIPRRQGGPGQARCPARLAPQLRALPSDAS